MDSFARKPFPMAQPEESSMKVFTLNVPPNRDIMEFIFDIAHKHHANVTVLSASGMINNVTIHSSTHGAHEGMLHGPFTLLSLTGSYLCSNHHTLHPGVPSPFPLCFGINLSSIDGHILGGVIGGSVIAGENVSLTISTFKNPGVLNYTVEGQEGHANNNKNKDGDFSGGGNTVTCGVRGW